jgi:DNA gyrase subunit B
MAKDPKAAAYGADQISVLEGLEPVRRRPGMYIGSTGPTGLHHLVWEIFDNSRDEAMGGFADHVELTLLPGDRIRVVDNGRGIPVGIHPKTKVSALETVMTVLHAGGKFGGEGSGYKVSGGLHGVGASVVNALSDYTRAEVHKEGAIWMQEYSQGNKKFAVKKIGTTKNTGTIITFQPDPTIFKEGIAFDHKTIVDHIRQQAYLVKKLRVTIIDARLVAEKMDPTSVFWFKDLGVEAPTITYYFEGGIQSMVRHYNKLQKAIHDTVFYCEKEQDNVGVEIALQYVDDITARIVPFANNIYNPEHGTHVTGFKTALTRVLNTYGKKNNLIKEADGPFSGDDVLEGLTVVISVKLEEIQFEGQTKAKLGSTEAQGATTTVFGEAFSTFLEENPDQAKAIIMKVLLALRARKAAKAAKDSILRKGALEGMTLPGKLADCQTKDAADGELFIVEGDSAGGTAKMGRDRRTQAILPLRGKILNVERARLDRMLGSEQIKNLVIAMGTSIGDTFDIEKIRYHKIIIATDADVDGAHITTLILTLLYRYFRTVIDAGFIYIAQPPLYKIKKG